MFLSAYKIGMLEFSVILFRLHQASLLNVNNLSEPICKTSRRMKSELFVARRIITRLGHWWAKQEMRVSPARVYDWLFCNVSYSSISFVGMWTLHQKSNIIPFAMAAIHFILSVFLWNPHQNIIIIICIHNVYVYAGVWTPYNQISHMTRRHVNNTHTCWAGAQS